MYIYLPDIKSRSGENFDYRFNEELSDFYGDFSEGGTAQLIVKASHSGEEVMIRGSIEASVEAVCSRCLEPFVQKVKTNFTESFAVIKGSTAEETPLDLAVETANMLTVTGDVLYLDEYIRQLIILAEDHSPLCKPDCKGICSGCGADLNRHSCQCVEDDSDIDIRLLKLKELKSGDQV